MATQLLRNTESWETPLEASQQLSLTPTIPWAWPSSHFLPAKCASVHTLNSQFLPQNDVGKSVKDFTDFHSRNNIHTLSLIYYASHCVIAWLAKQDLSFLNSCWPGLILLLSCTCCTMALEMVCSMMFLNTKVRLTGLKFCRPSFQVILYKV